jgi:uncharacterized protein (DUF952 family)
MSDPIFHITTAAAWQASLAAGESHSAASLETEGVIHCSTREQVPWVANRRYRDFAEPLVLLRLDPQALTNELKWETSEPAMPPFPHIYGLINISAVTEVSDLTEGPDGFEAPA